MQSVQTNKTFTPKNDFFMYVNKEWLDSNPIPEEYSRWGQFNILGELNKKRVRELVEKSPESYTHESKLVSVLYQQGMDIETRNSLTPEQHVKVFLDAFDRVKTKEELTSLVFDFFVQYGVTSPVCFSVYSDMEDANMNILHVYTSGLGLPDRDYYFDDDKEEQRTKYKEFMSSYTKLFNVEMDTDAIYNFEELMAEQTYTRVQKRDPHLRNNPTSFNKFNLDYPNLNLTRLFDTFNIVERDDAKVNVSNPTFVEFFNRMLDELSLDTLKNYFLWKFLRTVGPSVNETTERAIFDFYGKFLSGTPEMKPLWKRILGNVEDQLGMVVGKMYTNKYFNEESKKKAEYMVSFIKRVLRDRLASNDWMEDSTKKKALEKMDTMVVKIGYPDKWRNYSKLSLTSSLSYLQNNFMINRFDVEYMFSKLYKEVDRTTWLMDPQMVNAYYAPSKNEIVFPAGILQAPFFSIEQNMEENFGGIGSVIGHEMTHGFDDQGCKFDSEGNLNNWWSDKDSEHYKGKTDVIRHQFSEFMIEGKNINGDLTLGENIADLGGVSISLEALERYLEENPEEDKGVESYKLFFMNYARIWACHARREETLKRLVMDPHSPPCFRVNGIVCHLQKFYECFGVLDTDDMFKPMEERASVW